jgi:uncharacterized protein YfaS (alpha-2-macroglobulin family)
MLYIADILRNVDPKFVEGSGLEEKFMSGINRLLSMQTAEGGFSFWPGGTQPTYWGSAYVTHVLLEGKEAGYPIPQVRIDQALEFLERTLSSGISGSDPKYGYSIATSEPYMQFVLAKAGKGRKGRLRKLIKSPPANWGDLTDENTFLVKAALYYAGDRSYEKDLKNPLNTEISSKRSNGWSFWSALRTRGMQLTIIEGLFPGNPGAEQLAQNIARRLAASQNSYGFTTQELSWTASGLGKRVSSSEKGNWDKLLVMKNNKELKAIKDPKSKSRPDRTWHIPSASGSKSLFVNTNGLKGRAYAFVNIEGVKPGVAYQYGDHTLKVRRSYHDMQGGRIDPSAINLGDIVNVKLTLTNQSSSRIQNIALVDRFGAGLEVENPRLNRGQVIDWSSGTPWDLTYMNLRDDRVEFFGHLERRQSVEVIYTLRAVTAGEFSSPPVKAEAMYEPTQWSRYAGKKLKIKNPWEGM